MRQNIQKTCNESIESRRQQKEPRERRKMTRRTRKRRSQTELERDEKLGTVSEIAEVGLDQQVVETEGGEPPSRGRGTAGPGVGGDDKMNWTTLLRCRRCSSLVCGKRQRRRLDTIRPRRCGATAQRRRTVNISCGVDSWLATASAGPSR